MNPTDVTFSFQDIEPGWSCISFSKPPRLAKSRYHSLLQSLEGWRQTHPTRRIEKIQSVKIGRMVVGLVVLWSTFEHLHQSSQISHFHIDDEVRTLYGHEYAEALMQDVIGFVSQSPEPDKNVVLIARRQVSIAIIRPHGQAFVSTLDTLLDSLEPSIGEFIQTQFEEWSRKNEQGYFCATLPVSYHPR